MTQFPPFKITSQSDSHYTRYTWQLLWSLRFSSESVCVCTRRISIARGTKVVIHNNRNPARTYTYTYTWKSKTPKCNDDADADDDDDDDDDDNNDNNNNNNNNNNDEGIIKHPTQKGITALYNNTKKT